jgi:hypothetical protein
MFYVRWVGEAVLVSPITVKKIVLNNAGIAKVEFDSREDFMCVLPGHGVEPTIEAAAKYGRSLMQARIEELRLQLFRLDARMPPSLDEYVANLKERLGLS